jgi:hypothetical protein
MTESPTIVVPYFNNTAVLFDQEVDLSIPGAKQVLDAFLRLTSEQRLSHSYEVYRYYWETREDDPEWIDERLTIPTDINAIWEWVTPKFISVDNSVAHPDHWYVVLEGECEWEEEHGIMMVWRDGVHLCKVGPYDGGLDDDGLDDGVLREVAAPYFDDEVLRFDSPDEAEIVAAKSALEAFLGLNAARRIVDSEKVFSYYRNFRGIGDRGLWLDRVMGVPKTQESIWNRVTPQSISLKNGLDDLWYVIVFGTCGWDFEHGIVLSWRHGSELCYVGPDEGEFGDDNPHAEEEDANVIYLGGPTTA